MKFTESIHNMAITESIKKARELMNQGILTDQISGREFFTGYSYGTLYDWDQYFEAIVQLYIQGWPAEYIKNGVIIFLNNQEDTGFISRTVPLRSKQEEGSEHVKPFLAQIALMVSQYSNDFSWLTSEYMIKLKKYLIYWLEVQSNHDLSIWNSAPHSGMDNQHERAGWWQDRFCQGVDLNCYLVRECKAMAKLCKEKGDNEGKHYFASKAEQRAEAIKQLWNEEDGIFYDMNSLTGGPIKVKYVGIFATLWAGIASKYQAQRLIVDHLLNPKEFWSFYPIPALSRNENGYSSTKLPTDLGCNWRANTWIPTNYYVYHGLKCYGYDEIASLLALKSWQLICKSGFREYYDAETGDGCGLNPFWGWTLLVPFMVLEDKLDCDPTNLYDYPLTLIKRIRELGVVQ